MVSALTPAYTGLQSYAALLRSVREAISRGKQRAFAAVRRERVRTAWETGKRIHEHILLNQSRAGYGRQVLKKLSKDLGISATELYYMVEFAKTYPIFRSTGKLPWSHIESLLAVNDAQEREALMDKASKEKWTQDQIRREIRKLKTLKGPVPKGREPKLSVIKPGRAGVYRIVEKEEKKYYDLGFYTYLEVKGKAPKVENPPAGRLYTYRAQVTGVYDGDTFHARIDLGYGIMQEQRVRLLRVNAPEIISDQGVQAKKVLEIILGRDKGRILVQSKKLDQHGRPLAHVFIQGRSIDPQLLASGLFTVREGESG